MTKREIDVSVIITFHDEGLLAKPSLQSLNKMIEFSKSHGRTVEVLAALDRASSKTVDIVEAQSNHDWKVYRTDFGDPGLVRNHLISLASGHFVSILDGDDLWSRDWIVKALTLAETTKTSVLHPEFSYYFYESDFDVHSPNSSPHSQVKSHFVRHLPGLPSKESLIEIRLNNPWSAHCFATRDMFISIPYRADSKETGVGIEDWTFNAEVLARGYSHDVVPGTVHMLRQRLGTSQNVRNNNRGMLPDFSILGQWPIGMVDEA